MKRRVGLAIVRSQVRKGTSQDGHGVRIVAMVCDQRKRRKPSRLSHTPERTEESFGVGMHDPVSSNFESKLVILFLGGQDAIDEEVSGFEVIRFESQLLDGVPSGSMTSAHVMNSLRIGQPIAENWEACVNDDTGTKSGTKLTPSLSVNVGDLALDDGGVQETLVRDPQALGGLILIAFTWLLRGSYGFERGCGDRVVENSRGYVSARSRREQTELSLTGCCMTFRYGCRQQSEILFWHSKLPAVPWC